MAPAKSGDKQVDKKQLEKAVTALRRYLGAQDNNELLGDEDEFLYLLIGLQKSHPLQRKDKPIRIPVPHPLHDFEHSEICLFVKDDKSGAGHKAAKKRLGEFSNRAGITKVIGTSKLRTKYESFEAKRNLCRQFDLFLADDRIIPSLPKLIGKSFFRKKKQPIPINLTAKDLEEQFSKARECTSLVLSGGSCLTIKVARASFATKDAVENIQAVLAAAEHHIPKKWAHVQSVFIKSADSVALPVYQRLPDRSQAIT
jgi:ribosome biogenesis protein UTP30